MLLPAATDSFEHIVRYQGAAELVPFLLALSKAELPAVRQRAQTLVHELQDVRQKGEQHWQKGPTPLQQGLFFLTGLATYSQKEALAAPFANSRWILSRPLSAVPENGFLPAAELVEYACQLLIHRRPDWLDAWLGNTPATASAMGLNFGVLLRLESHGLLTPSARLVASAGVKELQVYGAEANTLWQLRGYLAAGLTLTSAQAASVVQLTTAFPWLRSGELLPAVEELIYERVVRNQELLKRAIPLFFEFDTELDWSAAHFTTPQGRNWLTWPDILGRLCADGHFDRGDLLTRSLLALRRDFRRPLVTWFKELFVKLHATVAERLARQNDLLELLAHPLPLVVNFAIEQLKTVWLEPGFDPAPLLRDADNLLARPDLKTSLKTLLGGLSKLAQHQTALAPTVGRLLARALAHADTAVQQQAAKSLASLLKAKKLALSAQDTSAITAMMEGQAELLGAGARAVLAPWLAAQPATSAAPDEVAAYVPKLDFIPDLSPATAIEPVADWHELLFLTGQVLKHDDPTALERWLDGLLRLQGQLPAGHQDQLRPYVLQVLPQLQKTSAAEAATLLSGPIPIWGHDGLAEALLLSWAADFRIPRVETVVMQSSHLARMPLLEVEQQRYAQAEGLLRNQQALPLLSTPTHAPHWVAPSTLTSKLLAYEKAGQEPAPADLALALARAAHAHPTEAATARHLLPQLHHTGLRELLAWFFGSINAELPAPAYEAAPLRSPAGPAATLTEALPELWAVAARTKAPYRTFSTLAAWLGYDYAGVAHPLHLAREVVAQQTTYDASYQASGQSVTHSWTELYWRSGAAEPAPSALLLYSPPAGTSQQGSWETNQLLAQDFPYLAAALPHYPAPLFEYILRCAAWADNLESSERDLVAQALRALLAPGPPHSPPATVVLASGLLHHTSLCRSLGQEVLLRAVTTGQLQPDTLGQTLGQQLAIGYAPAARLTSCLAALSGIDALTDNALHQVLDALLPELPATPIRNLRKLLEFYADLVARTRQSVPAAAQARLSEWRATPSLKQIASALAT
jgi:hypothetical protein